MDFFRFIPSGLSGLLKQRPVYAEPSPPATPGEDAKTAATASTGGEAQAPQMPPTDPSAPVQYENFSKEFQQIMQQDNFDGFRIEAAKAVCKNLQSSHSLFLGTTLREGGYIYQFGPNLSSEDGNFLAVGRVGIDGTVNGRLAKKFVPLGLDLKLQLTSHLKDAQRNVFELSTDWAGKDMATSLKIAHQDTFILNGAFTQVLTPQLQAGVELTWVAANQASIGTMGFRWAKGHHFLSGQLTRQPDFRTPGGILANVHGAKLQYVRKLSERLSLATEYEFSHPDMHSALRMGYEYTFRQARVQGSLDTAGRVGCFVQDMTGFGISGTIDYWRGDYKFGFMMHVQPPPEGQPQGGPGMM
uniref:Mitochondrial import receptor subunit TOM40 n=1 Tax=Chromera velia CCMP2878 TaxID=1169474 RepID=A0A0G4I4R7_9ALVE|mmetsp:Transcript_11987/g.23042  ORF Transcript_11987/g.23042 Transcript_11987/m.23042 type:complete len:357 (+) Transcript_11987:261-1331(+)|eukprot:Cvel_10986.t1-p1 / transcript=Cvel_10986.t1 / gene=Cvel_10986 / organism=Chromera_velia_CCMP2878 / gene_product=Mitochondrial import receptor subunit TOM40-1, putative / transcript_product=Mitochondrial import receptor subunit TOM40-1, putative / location=Cvel_scaffold676:39980-44345(+) / protein_length=356 / sequence_SO=supercontig / SO=protein_coding / is_pseudo=false